LEDDVEGAMFALQELTGPGTSRFDKPVRKASGSVKLVSQLANYGRKLAPGLSSRIFNSRFMPVWLWRYIKMTQFDPKK
jgi:hypothetical protein